MQASEELQLPTENQAVSRRSIIVTALVVAGVVACAVLAIILFWPEAGQFAKVQNACDPARVATRVADDGDTLILVAKEQGEVLVAQCVISELKIPTAVTMQIEETRALDGRQEASWEHYKASWTYHPDAGLNMIIQKN